jgi:uncharacterized membrane protein
MSQPDPAPDLERLRTAAHLLAAAVVGVPLIVLLLTQAVLRQLNPGGLDLSDPRAYEVELWIPCALVLVVMVVAVAIVFSRLARASGDRGALRYPALMLQLQAGIAIAAVALLLLTPGVGF